MACEHGAVIGQSLIAHFNLPSNSLRCAVRRLLRELGEPVDIKGADFEAHYGSRRFDTCRLTRNGTLRTTERKTWAEVVRTVSLRPRCCRVLTFSLTAPMQTSGFAYYGDIYPSPWRGPAQEGHDGPGHSLHRAVCPAVVGWSSNASQHLTRSIITCTMYPSAFVATSRGCLCSFAGFLSPLRLPRAV